MEEAEVRALKRHPTKTKAFFLGALKAQEGDVAEVAADGDLDFSVFDFDDFDGCDDLGTYDADAGKSCSSTLGPPPAPVLPALPEFHPKLEPPVLPVVVSAPIQAMPVFNFYFGHK